MKIFTGNANPKLAEGIARNLGLSMGNIQIARFPDDEISVKVAENIRGSDVFMIQPICYPPNEHLMELLIAIDALRRASAARITAVIPFYGYGRQDRKDQPRVPITAKLVANLLVAAGVSRVLTMDLHTQQIQGFFDIPVDHLCAAPVMVKYLREKEFKNLVIVSPDPGGMKMAYAYSRMLNSGLAIVAKQRTSPRSVETYHIVGEVAGRTAVLVDDLVATGSTLCAAVELLKKKGAQDVYSVVTHAVMIPEAFERLSHAPIKQFIVTDSVPLRKPVNPAPIKVLTVADLLAEAIRRIHNNQSVSSLFNI